MKPVDCVYPSPDFESDSRLFYLRSNTTNLSRIDPRLVCRWINPVSYTRCMALRAYLIPKLTLPKNVSDEIYNQKYAKNPMAWLVYVSFLCEQQQACASSKVCVAIRYKSFVLREQHLSHKGRETWILIWKILRCWLIYQSSHPLTHLSVSWAFTIPWFLM